MANGSLISEDLVVITTREGFVTEEVDGLVFNARNIFLGLDVPQAVGLIPSSGKDIKGNLPADRVPASRKYCETDTQTQTN